LKSGRVKILTNVGLWGTGVDIPFLSCLILARPTKSYILHIQQLGRGTRTYLDKKDFIVLDHAGNVHRHGRMEDKIPGSLDGKPKFKTISIKTCKACFAVIQAYPCEECGYVHVSEKTERKIEQDLSVNLAEISGSAKTIRFTHADIMRDIAHYDSLGHKPGFTWHKIKDQYGEQVAKNYLSSRFRRSSSTPR